MNHAEGEADKYFLGGNSSVWENQFLFLSIVLPGAQPEPRLFNSFDKSLCLAWGQEYTDLG